MLLLYGTLKRYKSLRSAMLKDYRNRTRRRISADIVPYLKSPEYVGSKQLTSPHLWAESLRFRGVVLAGHILKHSRDEFLLCRFYEALIWGFVASNSNRKSAIPPPVRLVLRFK